MNNTVLLVSKTVTTLPFKITFDANGGTCSTIQKDAVVGEKIGELPVPTYGDKYFDGWFTSREGGTKISADSLAGYQNARVYAHWIDPVEIEWDATTNGGTLVPHSYKYYPTVPFTNLPEANGPSDKPYLNGWWTTADESGEYITKSSIVGDVRKYYAHYKNYDDPIGLVICPTKNLYFTTESDKYFWTPSDSTITDGSGYLQTDISENWYYFNSNWWAYNYITSFKTSVTGPGLLKFNLEFPDYNNSTMRCFSVVSNDEFDSSNYYNTNLFAVYCSYLGECLSKIGGTANPDEINSGISSCLESGATVFPSGDVSFIYGVENISGEFQLEFTDNNAHPITFWCGFYDSEGGIYKYTAKISNVRWFPS